MALVFDVEAVGVDPASLENFKEFLTKHDKPDQESSMNRLALSPLTNNVVCIGCYDTAVDKGVCLINRPVPLDSFPDVPDNITYKPCKDEAEMLRLWWDIVSRQSHFVSYSGRSYDVPVLVFRSAVLGVPVQRKLVKASRYDDIHVDFRDVIENFGAMRIHWNFDLLCHALGVPSPKSIMSGKDVGKFWSDGFYNLVARYNMDDVMSLVGVARRLDGFYTVPGLFLPKPPKKESLAEDSKEPSPNDAPSPGDEQ